MRTSHRSTEIIILLGALTAFAPLSVDMYLPSLPSLAVAFSAAPGHVQLSLASFFLGLAIGQAFYGPISDRFGRKRPLYFGLVLFVLASAGCALASSINALIVLRFFAALGACSGQVIARAMVRDLFEGREAVRVFSLLILVMGASPALAPLLGGQILVWFEWRFIFGLLTVLGAIGLAGTILRLPETRRSQAVEPLALKSVLTTYYRFLQDRSFIGYALTGGMGMSGMFAYIVGSPFVFIELFHVSPSHFGWFFGANAAGLVAAAQMNVRLAHRFEPDAIIKAVLMIQICCVSLLLVGTVVGLVGLYGTATLLFIYVSSLGFLVPNTTAMAMAGHAKKSGSASALIGTLQFTLATTAASVLGVANSGAALPMAGIIALCGVSAFVLHRSLVRPSVLILERT